MPENCRMRSIRTLLLGLFALFAVPSLVAGSYILDFLDVFTAALGERYNTIHFMGDGNDYVGGMFVSDSEALQNPKEYTINGDLVSCGKKLKGLYYNMQRGQRIRPMDEDTRDSLPGYGALSVSGGLHTTCTTSGTVSVDLFDIVGHINYDFPGLGSSDVVAGGRYTKATNSNSGVYASSLGMFNNRKPLGFLYDNQGGLGFVGGYGSGECYEDLLNEFNTTTGTVNTMFILSGDEIVRQSQNVNCSGWTMTGGAGANLLWSVDIKGLVGLSDSSDAIERQSLIGNIGGQALLRNTDFANAATLLSNAKRTARGLCRGQPTYTSSTLSAVGTEEVLCIDNGSSPFVIDLANDVTEYANKVLIVQNGDVILQGSMPYDAEGFDLLVEEGNVLFENVTAAGDLTRFDDFGFPVAPGGGSTRGFYLNANLIVNGIIAGVDPGVPSTIVPYEHKVFIHGKMSVLNTPLAASAQRQKQLENLFGSSWLASNDFFINLQNSLKRRCNADGLGNDGFVECDSVTDLHALSSLIVITKTEPSKLISN